MAGRRLRVSRARMTSSSRADVLLDKFSEGYKAGYDAGYAARMIEEKEAHTSTVMVPMAPEGASDVAVSLMGGLVFTPVGAELSYTLHLQGPPRYAPVRIKGHCDAGSLLDQSASLHVAIARYFCTVIIEGTGDTFTCEGRYLGLARSLTGEILRMLHEVYIAGEIEALQAEVASWLSAPLPGTRRGIHNYTVEVGYPLSAPVAPYPRDR